MIYVPWDRNKKAGAPQGSGDSKVWSFARGSAPEQPSHEDRGEDGRGRCRRPFEDCFQNVVLDPTLLRYVYEPVRDVLADEVGDPGRHYRYESLLRRVVHEPSLYVLYSSAID